VLLGPFLMPAAEQQACWLQLLAGSYLATHVLPPAEPTDFAVLSDRRRSVHPTDCRN